MHLFTLPYLNELRTGWLSYFQLLQELIDGPTRRHLFSAWELELMLDLEASRLRKSSKPEVLRRYLRFVQAENTHALRPSRLSCFMESENQHKRTAKAANGG
jgi:hypothetical protein